MSNEKLVQKHLLDVKNKLKPVSNKGSFNTLKTYNNEIYTGMRVGQSHNWNYTDGKWIETKKAPDRWIFNYKSLKSRAHHAPENTGASVKTQYRWYIIADQIATKLDSNSYMTEMKGVKFKIGHKRPHWKQYSYDYPEQLSYKEKVIQILENIITRLRKS